MATLGLVRGRGPFMGGAERSEAVSKRDITFSLNRKSVEAAVDGDNCAGDTLGGV